MLFRPMCQSQRNQLRAILKPHIKRITAVCHYPVQHSVHHAGSRAGKNTRFCSSIMYGGCPWQIMLPHNRPVHTLSLVYSFFDDYFNTRFSRLRSANIFDGASGLDGIQNSNDLVFGEPDFMSGDLLKDIINYLVVCWFSIALKSLEKPLYDSDLSYLVQTLVDHRPLSFSVCIRQSLPCWISEK